MNSHHSSVLSSSFCSITIIPSSNSRVLLIIITSFFFYNIHQLSYFLHSMQGCGSTYYIYFYWLSKGFLHHICRIFCYLTTAAEKQFRQFEGNLVSWLCNLIISNCNLSCLLDNWGSELLLSHSITVHPLVATEQNSCFPMKNTHQSTFEKLYIDRVENKTNKLKQSGYKLQQQRFHFP